MNATPNEARHGVGIITELGDSSSSQLTLELSLSDLVVPTRPRTSQRRRSRRLHQPSKSMEESSSRTATTANNESSYIQHSGSFDLDLYHHSGSSNDHGGSSMDGSCLSMGSSSSSSRLRNLHGIRRRRSDPVTRRWREQCSKLYKEHVLDNFSEQCQHDRVRTRPSRREEVAPAAAATTNCAARLIQCCVRRFLSQKRGKHDRGAKQTLLHQSTL